MVDRRIHAWIGLRAARLLMDYEIDLAKQYKDADGDEPLAAWQAEGR